MQERCREVYNRIGKIITYRRVIALVLFLYAIMPLWIVSVNQERLLVAVVLQILLFGAVWRARDFSMLRPSGMLDYVCYGMGAFGILGIILYCVGMDIGYREEYDTELCLLLFALIYLTVKCRAEWDKRYADVILAGLMCTQIVCLIYYLVWPEMNGRLGAFVRNKESVAFCALLALLIAGAQYAQEKKKPLQLVYGVASGITAVVLAINHDVVSLYFATVMLLARTVYCEAKSRILKRNLQVLGGYVFLLCNMCLLTGYTKLLQIECTGYSLESSVVMELVLCVFLCYVMHIWDCLPQKEPEKRVQMLRKLQKSLYYVMIAFLVLLGCVLLVGNRLGELPNGMVWQAIETEGIVFWQAVQGQAGNHALYVAVKEYGALGVLLIAALTVVMVERMRKRYKPMIPMRLLLKELAITSVVLWASRVQGLTVYGIGIWLMVYAVAPGMKFKSVKKIVKNVKTDIDCEAGKESGSEKKDEAEEK